MLTLLLYGVVAIVLAGALFLVAAFVLPAGEQIAPSIRDEPSWELPGKELDYDDIATARLPVALRGYRFAETDRLLDRLAEELRRRDEEIARLRAGAAEDQERWAPPEASVRTHSKHALEDRPEDADGA
ncbi:MAG: DivIVA domain-containing protein [Jatrophihabitantaceae bacterium]